MTQSAQQADQPVFTYESFERPRWSTRWKSIEMRALREHFDDGGGLHDLPDYLANMSSPSAIWQAVRLRLNVAPGIWKYFEASAIYRYCIIWGAQPELLAKTLLPHRTISQITEARSALRKHLNVNWDVGRAPLRQDWELFEGIHDDDLALASLIAADTEHGFVYQSLMEGETRAAFNTPDAVFDALHYLYPRYGSSPLYAIYFADEARLLEHAAKLGLLSSRRFHHSDAAEIIAAYRAVGPAYCDLIRVSGRSRRGVLEFLVRNNYFVPGRRAGRSETYPTSPTLSKIIAAGRQWEACEDGFLLHNRLELRHSDMARRIARSVPEVQDRLRMLTGDSVDLAPALARLSKDFPSVPAEAWIVMAKLRSLLPLRWLVDEIYPEVPCNRDIDQAVLKLSGRLGPFPTQSLWGDKANAAVSLLRHHLPATAQRVIKAALALHLHLAALPAPHNDYQQWLAEEDGLLRLIFPRIGARPASDLMQRSREACTYRATQALGCNGAPVGNSPQRTYAHVRMISVHRQADHAIFDGKTTSFAAIERLARAGHWIVLPAFPVAQREANLETRRSGRFISWSPINRPYLEAHFSHVPAHHLAEIMGIDVQRLRKSAERHKLKPYLHARLPSVIALVGSGKD